MMKSQESTKPVQDPDSWQRTTRFKFLTRNLTISCERYAQGQFKKARIKRPFVKKLSCTINHEYRFSEDPFITFQKKKKLWKTIQHIDMPYLSEYYLYDSLKMSKNLKSFSINAQEGEDDIVDTNPRTVAVYLRKLPAKVEKIKFHVKNRDDPLPDGHFYKVAKSIKYLPNLRSFDRSYDNFYHENPTYLQKELQIYNQVVSKLPKLKKFVYNLTHPEQVAFHKAIKTGIVFSAISHLKLQLSEADFYLENREDPDLYRDSLDQEDSFDDSLNPVEEELKPFYSFELFPNLRELDILYGYEGEDGYESFIYPLGSFVVESFAALKNLEKLRISVQERPKGTCYFFKALEKLPLLKTFSLRIEFIKEGEWTLLQEFFEGQNKLESVCIEIMGNSDLEGDGYLELLIQCLKKKPLLRSLEIKSHSWSLAAMSKGFAHLKNMKNRLHTLKIQAVDVESESESDDEESKNHVKELCLFIQNQRDSLKVIEINIPKIAKDSTINNIGRAISKLSKLKELYLSLGPCDSSSKYPYFTLNKNLVELNNLEIFKLKFALVDLGSETLPGQSKEKWVLHVIEALPRLENLQIVSIMDAENTAFEQSLQFKIEDAFRQLINIRSIRAKLDFYGRDWRAPDAVESAVEEINQKQSMRFDLMF